MFFGTDNEEIKDDDEDSDDEFSDIEELKKMADKDLKGETVSPDEAKDLTQQAFKTTFNYEATKQEGLYGKYEDLNLWREEDDSSPYAGIDRLMAHFKGKLAFCKLTFSERKRKQGIAWRRTRRISRVHQVSIKGYQSSRSSKSVGYQKQELPRK